MYKEFKLGGVPWKIVVDNQRMADSDALGLCQYSLATILLADKNYENKPIIKEVTEHTLWHEVVHAILFTMGKSELSKDEEFVNLFSTFLHQYEQTRK